MQVCTEGWAGLATYYTGVKKFGGVAGDRSRSGVNAVLAPGTILTPDGIVARPASIDHDDGGAPR